MTWSERLQNCSSYVEQWPAPVVRSNRRATVAQIGQKAQAGSDRKESE